MRGENNRLFHFMGTKVVWINESDLKNYNDPSTVPYHHGERFLVQHAIWGTWKLGIYFLIWDGPGQFALHIHWTNVIVVNGK